MTKRILFVLAAFVLAGAGLYFRSANARQARIQADRIVQQDTASGDTAAAMASLTDYVKTHMGASVSLTFSGAYSRAQASAAATAAATATNSQIYAEAQRVCAGKNDSITQARCNQDYLAKHLVNVPNVTPVTAPKLADYQHKLRAPLWTPDLAGALLLGAAAALALSFLVFVRNPR